MSRRHKIKTVMVRVPAPKIPVSFRRPAAEIAVDELEFRAALDNVSGGSRDQRDVSRLAVAAMYCARVAQALRADPDVGREQIAPLEPVVLDGAAAIDALNKRLRAAGYVKATPQEHAALAGLLEVLGELDRVSTSRQQRDCMNRVHGDAALVRREQEGRHA